MKGGQASTAASMVCWSSLLTCSAAPSRWLPPWASATRSSSPASSAAASVEKVFKIADAYVMPSVSEPFGIAPLEAMSHDVPVIISEQSGVSEVVQNALKVDFWDINEMANKIVA